VRMTEWLTAALMIGGAAFMFVAAIGLARFPDVFTRMQAGTKGGTVGLGGILGAVALSFDQAGVTTAALLIIVFLFITAPVAAHMIARAAYFTDVPRYGGMVHDELAEAVRERGASAPAGPEPGPPASPEGDPPDFR
jgi:multicomponent Na+:H+ antiporter subunit G